MKTERLLLLLVFFELIALGWKTAKDNWIIEKHKGYNLVYTSKDLKNIKEYDQLIENGLISVKEFFHSTYSKTFDVVIHPNRHSLDSTWQKDWDMPNFKSECWMVASGVASKLDIISPKTWDLESCEHKYSETINTQKIVTHELVHVYHGQFNSSPDFSNIEGIDWFVEGLATYASGQLDSLRVLEIKKAISENQIPKSLDDFWKGKLKYGLAGSMVMYIDIRYGRAKLIELLPFNKKVDLLLTLKTSESDLIDDWVSYFQKY